MLNDRVGNCQKIGLKKQIGLFCKFFYTAYSITLYHYILLYFLAMQNSVSSHL